MFVARRLHLFAFLSVLGVVALTALCANGSPPVNKSDLLTLIRLQIDDQEILSRIREQGISFSPSEAALQELEKAGAAATVLDAVRSTRPPDETPAAVTFDEVITLVKLEIPEEQILQRLKGSPTVFALGADQVSELRAAGASDRLLAAMQQGQSGPPAAKIRNLAVIFDCSKSMKEPTPEGRTKMEAAREVVSELVERIPAGVRTAFVVYGHDKQAACQAVEVKRPLAELDTAGRQKLRQLIAGLQPVGNTPIALALETAAGEVLGREEPAGMVLITDGMETCGGKPAETAARLAAQPNLTFGVHVVGFDVKAEEEQAVKAIAEAGEGQFDNAQTAEQLTQAMRRVNERIIDGASETPPIHYANSPFSGVTVKPLTLAGFPEVKEVLITKPYDLGWIETSLNSRDIVRRSESLGKPMLISPGTYDVVLKPETGRRVHLVRKLEVKQGQMVTLEANRLASAIVVQAPQLEGIESPERLMAIPTHVGLPYLDSYEIVQQCAGFGQPMLVTAGVEYYVAMETVDGQRIKLFDQLQAEPGKLIALGQ